MTEIDPARHRMSDFIEYQGPDYDDDIIRKTILPPFEEGMQIVLRKGEEPTEQIDYAAGGFAGSIRDRLWPLYSALTDHSNPTGATRAALSRVFHAETRFHEQQFSALEAQAQQWRERTAQSLPFLLAVRQLVADAVDAGLPDRLPTTDALSVSGVEYDAARMTPLLFAKAATGTRSRESARKKLDAEIRESADDETTGQRLRSFYSGILAGDAELVDLRDQILDAMADHETSGHDFAEMLWVYDARIPTIEKTGKMSKKEQRKEKKKEKEQKKKNKQSAGVITTLDDALVHATGLLIVNDSNSVEKLLVIAQRTGSAQALDAISRSTIIDSSMHEEESQVRAAKSVAAIVCMQAASSGRPIDVRGTKGRKRKARAYDESRVEVIELVRRYENEFGQHAQYSGVLPDNYPEYVYSTAQIVESTGSTEAIARMLESSEDITVDTAARMLAIGAGDVQTLDRALEDADDHHKLIIGFNILLALWHRRELNIKPATAMAAEIRFQQSLDVGPESVQNIINELNQRFAAYVNAGPSEMGLEEISHLESIIDRMPSEAAREHLDRLLQNVLQEQQTGMPGTVDIPPV